MFSQDDPIPVEKKYPFPKYSKALRWEYYLPIRVEKPELQVF